MCFAVNKLKYTNSLQFIVVLHFVQTPAHYLGYMVLLLFCWGQCTFQYDQDSSQAGTKVGPNQPDRSPRIDIKQMIRPQEITISLIFKLASVKSVQTSNSLGLQYRFSLDPS